jgi:threonine dehydratase
MQAPTFADVLQARARIAPHLPRTPLREYPPLSRSIDATVFVKHENHLPTGAFKVRGGVNLISQLTQDERDRGVIASSTGNHGQSVAFGGRIFGVTATVCAPEGANPVKVAAMRDLGAEVILHGVDFDEAREESERLAAERGFRYIHSGNEPHLIAGVGTATLELLEDEPRIDTIIVPVGGGSGAAGASIVAKTLNPSIRVIGVQSAAAPAAFRSWRDRTLLDDEMQTFAEGLATRVAFELPQRIMWELLDDFVLVSDDEIRAAQRAMIESTRNLIEAAGASPFAAALHLRDELAGRRVALIASGGNASPEQLRELLA